MRGEEEDEEEEEEDEEDEEEAHLAKKGELPARTILWARRPTSSSHTRVTSENSVSENIFLKDF